MRSPRFERATSDTTCVWCWNKLDDDTVDLGKAKAHRSCDERMTNFIQGLEKVLGDA